MRRRVLAASSESASDGKGDAKPRRPAAALLLPRRDSAGGRCIITGNTRSRRTTKDAPRSVWKHAGSAASLGGTALGGSGCLDALRARTVVSGGVFKKATKAADDVVRMPESAAVAVPARPRSDDDDARAVSTAAMVMLARSSSHTSTSRPLRGALLVSPPSAPSAASPSRRRGADVESAAAMDRFAATSSWPSCASAAMMAIARPESRKEGQTSGTVGTAVPSDIKTGASVSPATATPAMSLRPSGVMESEATRRRQQPSRSAGSVSWPATV